MNARANTCTRSSDTDAAVYWLNGARPPTTMRISTTAAGTIEPSVREREHECPATLLAELDRHE